MKLSTGVLWGAALLCSLSACGTSAAIVSTVPSAVVSDQTRMMAQCNADAKAFGGTCAWEGGTAGEAILTPSKAVATTKTVKVAPKNTPTSVGGVAPRAASTSHVSAPAANVTTHVANAPTDVPVAAEPAPDAPGAGISKPLSNTDGPQCSEDPTMTVCNPTDAPGKLHVAPGQ